MNLTLSIKQIGIAIHTPLSRVFNQLNVKNVLTFRGSATNG
jgi:hypothetical protein